MAVMSPMCRPFGPYAQMNYRIHYDGWLKSYELAAPHGRFCGEVAETQLKVHRDFFNEQPHPSWLYEEEPWPRVPADPRVDSRIVDQCMAGAVGPGGGLQGPHRGAGGDEGKTEGE